MSVPIVLFQRQDAMGQWREIDPDDIEFYHVTRGQPVRGLVVAEDVMKELAELRADAERYRHLIRNDQTPLPFNGVLADVFRDGVEYPKSDIDAEIDKEIELLKAAKNGDSN